MQLAKKETAAETASEKVHYSPDVDIYEREDGIVLLADMPGVDDKSVDITLEKNVLSISGRSVDLAAPEGVSPVYREFGLGDYSRQFTLHADYDAEKIDAVVNNGALRLFIPRALPSRRQITVKAG